MVNPFPLERMARKRKKTVGAMGDGPLTSTIGGKMDPAYAFEFTVGETYENEKGMFLVLSIAKDDMVIRWQDGEEAQTSLELQGRIQNRRQWEKTLHQEKTTAAKPAPKKAKASKGAKQASGPSL